MFRLMNHLLTLFSLSALAAAGQRPRFEPLPICSKCVSREDILAPGTGFDLTASYGTAAIRYYNGSMVNLGRVDANQEYRELIIRLSDPESQMSCHRTTWEEIRCSLERAKRRLNKLRGLPATPSVGTIANLIIQLCHLTDSKLGQGTTKKVLPAVPILPGLSIEDLSDALEYAGLSFLDTHKHIGGIVSERSAAFAGMGHGLCKHYDNCDTCEDEEADMPYSHTLALSFSHAEFSAAYILMQSAFSSRAEKGVVRFDLGLGNLPQGEDEKAWYWSEVKDTIVSVGKVAYRPLTDLLLLGEDADNVEFNKVVKEALWELIPNNPGRIRILSEERSSDTLDPLYVAARGAAEFAKRAQEAPASCVEPPHCAENRVPQHTFSKDQEVFNAEL